MFTVTETNPAFEGHTYVSHPMALEDVGEWVALVTGDGGHVIAVTPV